jgi:signal transduction histidine kinase
MRQLQNISFNQKLKQQELESANADYKNKLKIYLLTGGLIILLTIAFILWRNNRQRQKAYRLLEKQKTEIDFQRTKAEQAIEELQSTQLQLIQREKMASLGELTAGIAHEIQNPLNFVNNFSEVNTELLQEMNEEIKKGNYQEVKNISQGILENEQKIAMHGKRADSIVKGMLQHSRSSSSQKEPTNINALADEYLKLSYHGLRAKDNSFNAKLQTDFNDVDLINIIPQDIGRVLLNLFNNAFYAVAEKKKTHPENYEPLVSVSTKQNNNNLELIVSDNGSGIPQKLLDKIFQPFFTTKPAGEGTGLGLSLSYEIIKAHGGEIKVNTKTGEGSEFIIALPISNPI